MNIRGADAQPLRLCIVPVQLQFFSNDVDGALSSRSIPLHEAFKSAFQRSSSAWCRTDTLLQKWRDATGARRSFKRMVASCPGSSGKIVSDQLISYPAENGQFFKPARIQVRATILLGQGRERK